jgi:UDP-glucose:(heptosyl)LPS alpha-1,3-glucosyltransferase
MNVARKLRVAVLNRVFSPTGGGAESYSIRVVEQLAARHDIHVFAQEIAHDWPGVSYHRVPRPMAKPRWINQLWYAWWTWRATRHGFDVVHSHENTWHGDVQTIHVKPVRSNLLAGRSGAALVLRWLKIATSPRLMVNLRLESARFSVRPGRSIVLTSQALRQEAVAVYPRAAPMMCVITPGVNLPGDAPSRGEARRLLGLPRSGALVLFVANDYARKGLDALLAAMALLPEGATLVVVGNPQGIPEYTERARGLGLGERVHFLGAMKDVGLAYRAATVLAHPTLDDTFAMVVLEAMAHGLPVVVSGPAHCGISSLLEDGTNALLLQDPRNHRQLAAHLNSLLSDSDCAERLSQEGKRFAQAHTWEEAARRYEALYTASP